MPYSLPPHESQHARPPCPSITISRSSLKLTSIKLVMPSSHLILCRPLFLLPPIPPSIRVFSSESTLHMRWPKYWSIDLNLQCFKMAAIGMRRTIIFHFLQAAQIVRSLDLIQHTLIKCMLYPSQCFRYRKYHSDKTENCKYMNFQWEKSEPFSRICERCLGSVSLLPTQNLSPLYLTPPASVARAGEGEGLTKNDAVGGSGGLPDQPH